MTTIEIPDGFAEYLKVSLEKLRAELAQAEADLQDATRRQHECRRHIAALEGVGRMLEPADTVPDVTAASEG